MQQFQNAAKMALELIGRAQVNVGTELEGAMQVRQFLLAIHQGQLVVSVQSPAAYSEAEGLRADARAVAELVDIAKSAGL